MRGCTVCVNAKKFSLCNQVEYLHLTLIKVTVFPVIIRESENIYKKIHFKLKQCNEYSA